MSKIRCCKRLLLLLTVSVAVLLTLQLLFVGKLNSELLNVVLSEPSNVVSMGRLKLNAGRCINVANKSIVVGYCEPSSEQGGFTLYSNGSLLHDASGLCISYFSKTLQPITTLGACDTSFTLARNQANEQANNTLRLGGPGQASCLGTDNLYPELGTRILLSKECMSDITMVNEAAFQKSIEALTRNTLPEPYERNINGALCDFQACSINRRAEPVKLLSDNNVVKCEHLADCVTVVVKTARRPHLVIRLADSIRTILGYDLKIVCVDDGPDDHPDSIVAKLEEYDIDYTVGLEDMGISLGRNLALKKVKTKYFMLVDDDEVFTNATNIAKLVDILDSTDASLVGGGLQNQGRRFAGTINFYQSGNKRHLKLDSSSCKGPPLIELSPQFRNCTQCDVVCNVFIAKLSHINRFGGWTEELKISEHRDFFVKMKSYGLKVVYCDNVRIKNRRERGNEEYSYLRHNSDRHKLMHNLFLGRYNINVLW